MTNTKTITQLYLKAEYDPYYIPPLTLEMEFLRYLLDNKLLGGPIGQNFILYNPDFTAVNQYDKLGPRSKDLIFVEDDAFHFERKRNISDEQINDATIKGNPFNKIRLMDNICTLPQK